MIAAFESNKDLKYVLDLIQLEKFNEAEKKIYDLKVVYPNNFFLENLHGTIFSFRGDYENAQNKFEKVIELEPNFADGYYNLATIFLKIKKFDSAVFFFNRTLEIDKNFYNAYFNLGICYKELDQIDNSIKSYNFYIQNVPNDLIAYINLGKIFIDLKQLNKAKDIFNQALSIDLSSVEANFNIGLIFFEEKKFSIAINFFQKAINFDKSFYFAYLKLAEVFVVSARFIEAIGVYHKFISLDLFNKKTEELADCHYRLANLQSNIGDLDNAFKNYDIAILYSKNINYIKSYIFHYNFFEKFNPKKYFELTNIYLNTLDIKNIPIDKFRYQKAKKIRIGFLSADLRTHAVGYQIIGILEKLSLDKDFEIYLYNLDKFTQLTDEITARFKILSNFWFDVNEMNAEELSKKIYTDEIQILFDLSGYTTNNFLEVFLYKPAPIQISWAGYLSSTGIKEIDYIIVDPYVVTEDFDNYFIEKPLVLNNIWSLLSVFENNLISNEAPFLKKNYVTFGSFNNIYKINKNIVKIWSNILNKVYLSKLKLINFAFNDEEVKKNFKDLFYSHGVKPEQLFFLGSVKREELFYHYNDIDIALDTFPYGGGTTSLEATWMSVPLLTKFEKSFLSRCGKSINTNLGLNDWVCETDDEYVNKAIKFATDKDFLIKTKDYLMKNKSKLFDIDTFTRNLSSALKKVWNDYNANF